VPVQPPDQPANVESDAGLAVSVTDVPVSAAEQVEPPADPGRRTRDRAAAGAGLAHGQRVLEREGGRHGRAGFSVTSHVPAPEQPPPNQSANLEPAAGVAVRDT
jgi:hypothetical protein